jgi:hypothetical protein
MNYFVVINHQSKNDKMNLLTTKAVKIGEKVIEVNKSIGAITIRTELPLEQLVNEKINIQIQRANGDNVEITNGNIPLKDYLVLGTIAENAIGCDKINQYALKATIKLTELDFTSIHLHEKDLLRIAITGMNVNKTYVIDGHEAPMTTDDVYTFQRKSMNSEHENMDFDVAGYDACVISNDASITEINLRFENGIVVKTTPQELIDLQESEDPFAQVNLDGTVSSSFTSLLQLPLKTIISINIRKEQGAIVNLLLRHDVDITNL